MRGREFWRTRQRSTPLQRNRVPNQPITPAQTVLSWPVDSRLLRSALRPAGIARDRAMLADISRLRCIKGLFQEVGQFLHARSPCPTCQTLAQPAQPPGPIPVSLKRIAGRLSVAVLSRCCPRVQGFGPGSFARRWFGWMALAGSGADGARPAAGGLLAGFYCSLRSCYPFLIARARGKLRL